MKQYIEEVHEFLESIKSDFYLDLDKYTHYPDMEFNTADETILTLLKVAESSLLIPNHTKYIYNTVNIHNIIEIVVNRISKCGDEKLRQEAEEIIKDMESYRVTFYIKKDINDSFDSLYNAHKSNEFKSINTDTDIDTDTVGSFDIYPERIKRISENIKKIKELKKSNKSEYI